MRTPEQRRRSEELQAEANAHYARAQDIFDRVEKRLQERRARREQSFFQRLFRRAA